MPTYSLTMFGEKVWQKKMNIMGERVANPRPAFKAIAAYLMGSTKKTFAEQGPGWTPLSDSWLNYKASHGFSKRILRMRGALQDSVTKPGAAGQLVVIGGNGLIFGSRLPYAEKMQKGDPVGNIPARPFLGVSFEDQVVMAAILREYFTGAFGESITETQVSAIGGGKSLRGPGGRFIGSIKE